MRHRADLGHSSAIPAAQQGEPGGAVGRGRRSGVRCQSRARQWRHRSRFARDTESAADPADEAIGAIGGDSQRTGLVNEGRTGARIEPFQPLEGELGQDVERLLGLQSQGPVVTRPCPWRAQVRLRMSDHFEPGGLLGGDLGFLHPALALGVGAGVDVGGRGVARQAQGIIEIATAQVLECHADLPSGRGVEDVGRRIQVELRVAVDARRLDELRDRPDDPDEVILVQAEPGRLVDQESAIGQAQPPLGGAEADAALQLVELPVPFGPLDDCQLGVVSRARCGIAQERSTQCGDLVEIELVRMPGLRVPRAHRPCRLLALERSLDLRLVSVRINSQPGVIVGHHGCVAAGAAPRRAVSSQPGPRGGSHAPFYRSEPRGSTEPSGFDGWRVFSV